MSNAPEWKVTDNKKLLEYIKEFERIITVKIYNQVEIPEITQTTPHGLVWE
jgi:hypothetical protein